MSGTIKRYLASTTFLPLDVSMALTTPARKKFRYNPFGRQRLSTESGTFSWSLIVRKIKANDKPDRMLKNEEQKCTVSDRAPDNGFGN